jgi:hypothetical protein
MRIRSTENSQKIIRISCRFNAAELLGTRRVPVGREVFVLRVIHGARDLENLFAG